MREPVMMEAEDLRRGPNLVFEGADFGGAAVSFFLVRAQPGRGPGLHKHPYDEIWILDQGTVSFTAGSRTFEAAPGAVAVVPAGTPHAFTNNGTTPLRMTCIHPVARMETEWLETERA